jgi:hypothetical protein
MLAVGAWVAAEEINVPSLTSEERLTTILSGFDEAQESTHTLVAAFQERKNLQMLRDPVESSGQFFYSKPHRVKSEKVNVQRYSDKLFRAFGIGQTTSELKKYYDIELADDSGVDGAYLMVLLPKKRRIQKRIETLKIWVSDDSFLPVQMEYLEPDGDSTILSFEKILINQEIMASRFQINLPSDVIVTDSFTGVGGIGQQ